jgi:RNA methyltransferase, TrmH family
MRWTEALDRRGWPAEIASARNPRLRELRRLAGRRHRDQTGLFLAEGEDLLVAALRGGWVPEAVLFDPERIAPGAPPLDALPEGVPRVAVRAPALASLGSLGHPARVIGVWRQRWSPLAPGDARVALYLHVVSDPANVGAAIRSASALGPSLVVLGRDTADPFGPKAVRASMGALFAQPVSRATFDEARAALGAGWVAVGLDPRGRRALHELAVERPLFALGAERRGLSREIVDACDVTARIPLASDGAESLNVAMAATVSLYEQAVHRLRR